MATSSNLRYQILAGVVEERGIETVFKGQYQVGRARSLGRGAPGCAAGPPGAAPPPRLRAAPARARRCRAAPRTPTPPPTHLHPPSPTNTPTQLCAVLSFIVRTANTFLGSLLWVDFVRLLGMQKAAEPAKETKKLK
jgi:hypothetical protein